MDGLRCAGQKRSGPKAVGPKAVIVHGADGVALGRRGCIGQTVLL